MSDHKKVNTKEVHEQNYILYNVLEKSTSKDNKNQLEKLGKEFKKKEGITVISDKPPYYEFLKKKLSKFENIKKIKWSQYVKFWKPLYQFIGDFFIYKLTWFCFKFYGKL